MKIFTAEQIRKWDEYTIKNEPISSVDLMERAARVFADWLFAQIPHDQKVTLVCGPGNNGGDGLVVARSLHRMNFDVEVICCEIAPRSEDNEHQFQQLPENLPVLHLRESDPLPDIQKEDTIVDALFGSGLNRPVTGYWGKLIHALNASQNIYAIDIPSGIFSEPREIEAAIKAKKTLTFQAPKLSFLFPEFGKYIGDWDALSIGLHPDYAELTAAKYSLLTSQTMSHLLKDRDRFSHKGDFGRGLLLAGSRGMYGASILSARAALRSGLGLLTIQTTEEGLPILQSQVPEALVRLDPSPTHLSQLPPNHNHFDALAIGPGLSQTMDTHFLLKNTLKKSSTPLIIDADALNILASNPDLWSTLPTDAILTPHPGEFDRLFGSHVSLYQRVQTAIKEAQKRNCILILKGAYTHIVGPDGHSYFNSTGNPGLASGGSGDVLTGILLGLRTQGYNALDTALVGVYLHGLAADIALQKGAQESLLASDVIAHLGQAFRQLHSK